MEPRASIDRSFLVVLVLLAHGAPSDAQSEAIVVHGPSAHARAGRVTGLSDVDGDQVPDFAVGAYLDDLGGTDSGGVRVHSGRSGALLATIAGDASGDEFGVPLANAGDVDGDGCGDLVVGARLHDGNGADSGLARVVSGRSGATLLRIHGTGAGDQLGTAVAGVGDVDGDGRADLAVGAPRNDAGGANAGAVYVVRGSDGTLAWSRVGGNAGDGFGRAVANAGDVDGDGRLDVIVGAPFADTGATNGGAAYVFSGVDGALLREFAGAHDGGSFGAAVASADDVDRDGFDDVIVGAPFEALHGPEQGAAYVHSGRTGALLLEIRGDSSFDQLGTAVASAGDADADGFPDVLVGAPRDAHVQHQGGSVRVVSGRTGLAIAVVHGRGGYDAFGTTVAGLGDVNGDGFDDWIGGASYTDVAGVDSGSAHLVLMGWPAPIATCGAPVNAAGCIPAIVARGTLSLSTGAGLDVGARFVVNQQSGVLVWSRGSASTSFGAGTLCVAAPLHKAVAQSSGGSPFGVDCTGAHAFTFTSGFALAHGLTAGRSVFAQWIDRDPSGLPVPTDAVKFVVVP